MSPLFPIDWRPIADWQSLGLSSANDWHASRLVARYEYDAYGNSLLDPTNTGVSGAYAAANPFRFSTKYCEGDLDPSATSDDLYYYGYRYYRPDIGRWVNRDPLEEDGGYNLLAYLLNGPTNLTDFLGLIPEEPRRCVKSRDCSDCWSSCKANQAIICTNSNNVKRGGAVLCRADGCRCACLCEADFPPGGTLGQEAARICELVHEEYHVRSKHTECNCTVYPCTSEMSLVNQQEEECRASAAQVTCLRNQKQRCSGDPKCLKLINRWIKAAEDYCKQFGGDVYEYGAEFNP